jgi:hypothetical protein
VEEVDTEAQGQPSVFHPLSAAAALSNNADDSAPAVTLTSVASATEVDSDPGTAAACTFAVNNTGTWCTKLSAHAAATTVAACRAACCALGDQCKVYQFCPATEPCFGTIHSKESCWLGPTVDCAPPGSSPGVGWIGESSSQPPAPSPPPAPTPAGSFTVTDVRIHENSFTDSKGHGTRASRSLTQAGATAWKFDFCAVLLFPQIASVRYSLTAGVGQAGFVQAMAQAPSGCTVDVVTDKPFTGTITVDVDSSTYDGGMI